jgi:PIN domain nuclease of toxin-antitoxin system
VSLLLDTHVVLWWLADDLQLPEQIKDRLDQEPDVRVSAATIWEIAIKQALGKIGARADLAERVRDSGFRELPVGFAHAMAAGRLPPLHRDPFDRMLVAQARCEELTLVTKDPRCQQYDVAILPV